MFLGSYWGRSIRAFSHSKYIYRKGFEVNRIIQFYGLKIPTTVTGLTHTWMLTIYSGDRGLGSQRIY